MPKRSFTIAFKKEVIDFVDQAGGSVYKATKQFEGLSFSTIHGWYKNKDNILAISHAVTKRRVEGGGRKPNDAGFSPDVNDWHIARHDVYGELFRQAWRNTGPCEIDPEVLEEIPQDDDIDVIDDALDGLELDLEESTS